MVTAFLKYLYRKPEYGNQFFPVVANKYNLTETQVVELITEWLNFEAAMDTLLNEPEYDDDISF